MSESSNPSSTASNGSAGPARPDEPRRYGLFEVTGIELEYMLVGRGNGDVAPVCDRILHDQIGDFDDAEFDDATWCNELVLHVIEMKTSRPAPTLAPLAAMFLNHARRICEHAAKHDARLVGGGTHPWMDPHTQMKLYPHGCSEIYDTFHRIFDCRGHGWANLQALHVNLPFGDDDEFGRLHAAVRLMLPIAPAIAAASPIMDGAATGLLDNRVAVYRTNCRAVPACTGQVIPEPVFSIDEYHGRILGGIYEALAPHDPQGILRHEWANARGAIARFMRNTIEFRLLDAQESPVADLAVAAATVEAIKNLVFEQTADYATQRSLDTDRLAAILDLTVRDGDHAVIEDRGYLRALGIQAEACTAGDVWRHLLEHAHLRDASALAPFEPELRTLLTEGPLARRMLGALGDDWGREELKTLVARMGDCLVQGRMLAGTETRRSRDQEIE